MCLWGGVSTCKKFPNPNELLDVILNMGFDSFFANDSDKNHSDGNACTDSSLKQI